MSYDEREYARKRAEQRQQSSWYKLKEGDNTFRILPTPPTATVKTNFFEYAVHRDVGPKKQVVRCGINPVTEEGECWLCDVKIPSLRKKKMETRATALAPKAQLLVQIAKVDDDGKMTGPFLFTPAKTIADQLLASIFGSRKRSYVDPAKGFNISINRTGTGKNDTRYGILEPDQESSKVPQSLLEKLKPFEELKEVPAYSQAKQSAAYLGQDVAEEEEEEPEKLKTHKRVAEEDVDNEDVASEEDDIDEDDDDLDEPAPKSKAKTSKKVVEEDVDEEDIDEDDDDLDEPAPKTKAKASKKVVEPDPDVDDDEDIPDDLDEEDAEDEPEPAPKTKAKASKKVVEEDVDEEDIDEDEPAPKSKAKASKKAKPEPEDIEEDPADEDIDLDDIEDEDEAASEPAPKTKAKASKVAARPKPKARR
jgi:hypothetical protein